MHFLFDLFIRVYCYRKNKLEKKLIKQIDTKEYKPKQRIEPLILLFQNRQMMLQLLPYPNLSKKTKQQAINEKEKGLTKSFSQYLLEISKISLLNGADVKIKLILMS